MLRVDIPTENYICRTGVTVNLQEKQAKSEILPFPSGWF